MYRAQSKLLVATSPRPRVARETQRQTHGEREREHQRERSSFKRKTRAPQPHSDAHTGINFPVTCEILQLRHSIGCHRTEPERFGDLHIEISYLGFGAVFGVLELEGGERFFGGEGKGVGSRGCLVRSAEMSMYGFEALNFNVDGGYLEAIVRGYRSGMLTSSDYNNLCQCENLDDIKMHLGATDYGPYLANGGLIFFLLSTFLCHGRS